MASIIEELITTLEQECKLYEELIPIAEEKTKIIIKNDLESLHRITEQEQLAVDKVNVLEKKREEVILNVGTVLNKKAATLTVGKIIKILDKQPKDQQELANVHDNLKKVVYQLIDINKYNASLIQQSLEMIEFDLNLIQSTRTSPGNNNYTKGASTMEAPIGLTGVFDAKQ